MIIIDPNPDFPLYKWFEIHALMVWGRARYMYLSVKEVPRKAESIHIIMSVCVCVCEAVRGGGGGLL